MRPETTHAGASGRNGIPKTPPVRMHSHRRKIKIQFIKAAKNQNPVEYSL
jgi:hypothetical protein